LSGLGTHLTLNLDNEVRFGPDVEWLEPKLANGEDEPDFWESKLAVTDERMELAINEVKKFLPNVVDDGFAPDCTFSFFFSPSLRAHLPLCRLRNSPEAHEERRDCARLLHHAPSTRLHLASRN
jgi:hypothetical protein